jgi:biopolymer transport protein ExbD
MAKFHRMRPPRDIPDAPMADVAFLLLIFFLSTTTIVEEYGLSLLLPARSRVESRPVVDPENVMVITTDAAGEIFYVDDEPVLSVDEIRLIVMDRSVVDDRLVVSVEPHPEAPYRAMIDILDELKLAGARRISLKTRG